MRSLLLIALFGLACATTPRPVEAPSVQRDGHTLDAATWQQDEQAILQRAAFEFSCAKEQIRTTILKTFADWRTEDTYRARASQVGVDACGQKAVTCTRTATG